MANDPPPRIVPLLDLVRDLVEQRDLRRLFNTTPDAVVRRYGLKPAERRAFYTMDPGRIGEEIKKQIQQIPATLGDTIKTALTSLDFAFLKPEFPRTSHLFTTKQGTTEYPSPTPKIFRIHPTIVTFDTNKPDVDQKFECAVYGQSFSPDAMIELTAGSDKLTVEGFDVFGTFRSSEAYGVVTPKVGTYTVRVINTPATPEPIDAPTNVVLVVH